MLHEAAHGEPEAVPQGVLVDQQITAALQTWVGVVPLIRRQPEQGSTATRGRGGGERDMGGREKYFIFGGIEYTESMRGKFRGRQNSVWVRRKCDTDCAKNERERNSRDGREGESEGEQESERERGRERDREGKQGGHKETLTEHGGSRKSPWLSREATPQSQCTIYIHSVSEGRLIGTWNTTIRHMWHSRHMGGARLRSFGFTIIASTYVKIASMGE